MSHAPKVTAVGVRGGAPDPDRPLALERLHVPPVVRRDLADPCRLPQLGRLKTRLILLDGARENALHRPESEVGANARERMACEGYVVNVGPHLPVQEEQGLW